jgi:phosphatidylinositol kinase/protein kinase (PI-3  family)
MACGWIRAEEEKKVEMSTILRRITHKLKGNGFEGRRRLAGEQQFEKLTEEATAVENLCGMFKG